MGGHSIGPGVLELRTVVASVLSESLDKPFPWAAAICCGNTGLTRALWLRVAGISGFDDLDAPYCETHGPGR